MRVVGSLQEVEELGAATRERGRGGRPGVARGLKVKIANVMR
jgi:hypothetical protein